ncbi:hypothetical protein [Microbaculum marinum]|uniref:Lipoprotein n=1 Tax=Microbaculum marinum TaxID=1764581 RepID=A0AAW9RP86_9HYPH
MWKLALAICSALTLTGCVSNAPATVEAECRLFTDPGFAVRGAEPRDQRWISRTQEIGIRSCGWDRPG